MKKILHKEYERGKADYGWLKTRYSFSFANWYDESKMGFGALRVLNDDVIAPETGFDPHGHRDMEIITIVMRGEVKHADSMNNSYTVKAGEVQVMTAGTGVLHSEHNESATTPLELFQLWIEPVSRHVVPCYNQKFFDFSKVKNTVIPLVHKEKALSINQDAYIFYGAFDEGKEYSYTLKNGTHGVYLFIISGEVLLEGEVLTSRDALGITEASIFSVQTKKESTFLIIEVPM